MWRQTGTLEQRISSSLPTASSSAQITFTCLLVLPMTNPPLVRRSASSALWEFLVRRRQVLPRANQGGVRCPLNKPPMPPSKEARSVPVSAPTGCCLPGIRLKISLVTIKFLVKGLHVEGVRETEDRALGTETRRANVQCIHYWQDTRLQSEVEMMLGVLIFYCSSLQCEDKGCTVHLTLISSGQTFLSVCHQLQNITVWSLHWSLWIICIQSPFTLSIGVIQTCLAEHWQVSACLDAYRPPLCRGWLRLYWPDWLWSRQHGCKQLSCLIKEGRGRGSKRPLLLILLSSIDVDAWRLLEQHEISVLQIWCMKKLEWNLHSIGDNMVFKLNTKQLLWNCIQ